MRGNSLQTGPKNIMYQKTPMRGKPKAISVDILLKVKDWTEIKRELEKGERSNEIIEKLTPEFFSYLRTKLTSSGWQLRKANKADGVVVIDADYGRKTERLPGKSFEKGLKNYLQNVDIKNKTGVKSIAEDPNFTLYLAKEIVAHPHFEYPYNQFQSLSEVHQVPPLRTAIFDFGGENRKRLLKQTYRLSQRRRNNENLNARIIATENFLKGRFNFDAVVDKNTEEYITKEIEKDLQKRRDAGKILHDKEMNNMYTKIWNLEIKNSSQRMAKIVHKELEEKGVNARYDFWRIVLYEPAYAPKCSKMPSEKELQRIIATYMKASPSTRRERTKEIARQIAKS